MNVSELMYPTYSVDAGDTVFEAAKLMRDNGVSYLVATSGGSVEGVITDSDMVLGCMADGHIPWRCSVGRHMIAQRQTVAPDAHIDNVSLTIIDGELDYLPVVAKGRLEGLLTSERIFGVIDQQMAYSTV